MIASLAVVVDQRNVLVDPPPDGSTCLNAGCVPSKVMIGRARIAHLARTAARYHVQTSAPRVDLAGIVREKNQMIGAHRAEGVQGAPVAENLTRVEGAAPVVSPREVAAGDRVLRADTIFIATGPWPGIPPIEGLENVRSRTNESGMELTELAKPGIVVAGGSIAGERGQTFRRYGSPVTIIPSHDHLVPLAERDGRTLLDEALATENIALVLDYRAQSLAPPATGVRLTARSRRGQDRAVAGSHLLVAAARRPNTDVLNLGTAGVEVDEKGFVKVDDLLATPLPGHLGRGRCPREAALHLALLGGG